MKILLVALSLVLSISIAFTQTPSAENAVTTAKTPDEIVQFVYKQVSTKNLWENPTLKSEVESHVDYQTLAKNAFGQDFKKWSESDRQWFVATVKEIITRTVYPKAPEFFKDVKITFKPAKLNQKRAKVESEVQKKSESLQVDYIFHQVDGQWKIVDVSIEEESWTETISTKIAKAIKEKGKEGLKKQLAKRLDDLKKGKNTSKGPSKVKGKKV